MPRQDEMVWIEVYIRGGSADDLRELHKRFKADAFADVGPVGYVRRQVTEAEIDLLTSLGMLFHRSSDSFAKSA